MTPDAQALSTQPAAVFVGREHELALLRAALAAAIAGHGRLVMLAGELRQPLFRSRAVATRAAFALFWWTVCGRGTVGTRSEAVRCT